MCCGSDISKLDLPTKDGQVDFRDNHGCCRDLYCLILFIACAIAMIVIFAVGFSRGKPQKLYAPMDKFGGFCGLDDGNSHDKKDFPNIIYYDVYQITEGVCVDKCPTPDEFCYLTKEFPNGDIVGKLSPLDMSACLTTPGSLYEIIPNEDLNITTESITQFIEKIKNLNSLEGIKNLTDDFRKEFGPNFNFVITDSKELINRCVPNIDFVLENLKEIDGLNDVFTAAVNDVKVSWWLFLVTIAITLVVAFVVIFCLQCFAKLITWCLCFAAILLVIVIGIIALIYGFSHYRDDLQSDKTSSYIFIGFGFGCLAAAIILIILLIALRKRISLAAALVQVASDAIKSNLLLILVPIVYGLIFVIVAVLLLITMVYYFSSLEVVNEGKGVRIRSVKINTQDRGIVVFVVFCFWWVTFLIIGMNQYTIAGAGAYHYFSRKGEKPYFPIGRTLVTLVLHHIGSIAVGSFLIALVATVRTILLYLAKKAKKANNEQLKCLISCLQCCLGCLQKCIEFIASRAYIMMAIQGKNFWVSAFDALTLLLANPLRTALLTAISKFLVIMAELTVAGLSVLISFIILRPDVFSSDTKPLIPVMYWWFIAFICAIIAFFFTWIIFQVYESLIDTMFFCFLYDEHLEENLREAYTTYCPEDMKQYMTVVDTNAREDDEDDGCCCCGGGSSSNNASSSPSGPGKSVDP